MNLEVNIILKKHNNKIILKNISFKMKNGEIAIFIGKSGAGKSTLLRILNHLDTDYEGSILINQKASIISENNFGLVFQDFNLFSYYTVIENITLPLTIVKKKSMKEATVIAEEILKEYELLELKNRKIRELSGGQKQRLAIARTIAMQSKIICFDEPFSALDPYLTKYIINKIKDLQSKGYIIILTTHNVSILEYYQGHIYFLDNGNIKENIDIENFYKNKSNYYLINKFINGEYE